MSRPSGYPLNIFLEEIDNKYCCSFCRLILKNPIQHECGHRFCKDCIDYIISNDEEPNICPACFRENNNDDESSTLTERTFPDMAAKRELSSMRTKCLFEPCLWSGSFKEFEPHYETCLEREIGCVRLCGAKFPFKQEKQHLENECILREVVCCHCKLSIVFADLTKHNESCSEFPEECPTCPIKLSRQELQIHKRDCENRRKNPVYETESEKKMEQLRNSENILSAAFERIENIQLMLGNPISSSSSSTSNLSSSSSSSSSAAAAATPQRTLAKRTIDLERLTSELVKQFENVLQSSRSQNPSAAAKRPRPGGGGGGSRSGSGIGINTERVEGESAEDASAAYDLRAIDNKFNVFAAAIFHLNTDVGTLTTRVDDLRRLRSSSREELGEMDKKVKSLERILTMKDVTLAELNRRITALELTSYDGTISWKVTEFNRRRREAVTGTTTSLFSPAFYTSKTGYKMCARLYLNGDGMGKGTHISLFFVIMRGHYDALLRWPFRQKVTLIFLDQNGREHITDAFRPDQTSSSFKRPTTEMNIASGCPLFVSLSQLDSPAHAYVKDDAAFIKIIINCDV